jgi:CubicO group peptidase (beta-lactamase class C family)
VVVSTHNKQEGVSLYGDAALVQACPPQDVLFEIGSITKVFTALLLARLTVDGEIDPDRPISDICKVFSGAPVWITPKRLASHASGLPRLHIPLWRVAMGSVGDDPYADFSRDDLIAWMRNWRPAKPPRQTAHAYSNLGFGLLGEVLAISQGREYEDLLRDKVLVPLGLRDTSITLTEDQRLRFLTPHDASGKPVLAWTFKSMAGAGALRSTAGDLARFANLVIAALEGPRSAIEHAIALTAQTAVGLGPRGGAEPISQCLGWISMTLNPTAPRMLFHDGGTAGSTSAIYVCPQKRAAIVLLTNRGVAAGVWSSLKLGLSNPHRFARDHFAAL